MSESVYQRMIQVNNVDSSSRGTGGSLNGQDLKFDDLIPALVFDDFTVWLAWVLVAGF